MSTLETCGFSSRDEMLQCLQRLQNRKLVTFPESKPNAHELGLIMGRIYRAQRAAKHKNP